MRRPAPYPVSHELRNPSSHILRFVNFVIGMIMPGCGCTSQGGIILLLGICGASVVGSLLASFWMSVDVVGSPKRHRVLGGV